MTVESADIIRVTCVRLALPVDVKLASVGGGTINTSRAAAVSRVHGLLATGNIAGIAVRIPSGTLADDASTTRTTIGGDIGKRGAAVGGGGAGSGVTRGPTADGGGLAAVVPVAVTIILVGRADGLAFQGASVGAADPAANTSHADGGRFGEAVGVAITTMIVCGEVLLARNSPVAVALVLGGSIAGGFAGIEGAAVQSTIPASDNGGGGIGAGTGLAVLPAGTTVGVNVERLLAAISGAVGTITVEHITSGQAWRRMRMEKDKVRVGLH